ncbi:titin isoform X2 [Ischnura elegans]|uniref:titin isoform X2 n=1 Tax=Ischnura elegans TaxID=197161 RepID=UPI001ED87849|nr:titin isoform X2 [Ischnura elegans]
MEAASILGVLGSGVAVAPGGRDRDGRALVILRLPPGPEADAAPAGERSPTNISLFREDMDCALRYLTTAAFSEETRRCRGVTLLVDARRAGAWREVRGAIKLAEERLSTGGEEGTKPPAATTSPAEGRSSPDSHPSAGPQNNIIVIRPDSGAFFWSKQRGSAVHCARSGNSEAQPIYVTLSRLLKYVENSQLPEDLGGSWPFDLDLWLQNRMYCEAFVKDAVGSLFDLEKVCARLSVLAPGARVSSTEDAFCLAKMACNTASEAAAKVLLAGKGVLQALDVNYNGGSWKSGPYKIPQDILDSRDKVEKLLDAIQSGEKKMKEAWTTVEKQFGDAREANALEDGVRRVTDWILGPAELLLNSHSADVGSDIASSEELRLRHEALEMLCRETYGQYAELLHKIDCLPMNNIALPKDLKSQRDFMDFVCRSFASRLERRRNILITCLRFYRLVAEYFDRTSEVFETYISHEDVEDFESADSALHDLQENQTAIDAIEQEVLREGEKLTDLLCMPAKDALGRDLGLSREGAILEVRGVLRATATRARIFSESVELQKLRLEQISHIRAYEKDATQAMQWLNELFQVLLESHSHVGCNVAEIQLQKEQHQAFQETAKGTYEYGCQLVSAALSLRQSCELPVGSNECLGSELWKAWDRLQAVGREQMTRLRVSAVFHRSVQEHCNQLVELIEKVKETKVSLASNGARVPLCSLTKGRKGEVSIMASAISLNDSATANDSSTAGQTLRGSMRRLLARREKLLMEVGRMVRLGRLLRTRLREPLYPPTDGTQGVENSPEKTIIEDSGWRNTALSGIENLPSAPPTTTSVNSEPYNNATAVEAISEKLSEVTALAESLDNSLCASVPPSNSSTASVGGKSRRRPFSSDLSFSGYSSVLDSSSSSSSTLPSPHVQNRPSLRPHSNTLNGRRMAAPDGVSSAVSTQDVYTRMKAEGAEEDDEEEEFVTASECTRSPSRSSSYHTASDGGGGGSGTGLNLAHWWQDDEVEDSVGQVLIDPEATRSGEVDTSDKQGEEEEVIPLPPPPPPLPPSLGKMGLMARKGGTKVKESTETTLTQIKVSQSHTTGIMSYVVTSEKTKDGFPIGENAPTNMHDKINLKDDTELISDHAFEASLSEQSTSEAMQNEMPNGTISEEELMQQMEESRDWLQLKIVEAVPEPSRLGSTLAEAVAMQIAHDNVLMQLQSKQSPVEELLRQADQLISTQRPRAEVYAAMAESLGLAWKDVNSLLELRKTVLDLNVAYHSQASLCIERMHDLEAECRRKNEELGEDDPELVKAALTRLHESRKLMLESLSAALQEGKALLGKTKEIAASGTLDSRPDKIRTGAEYAVSQVEHWLESLHDQRQSLDGAWRNYRSNLERQLALSLLASDLTALEKALYQAKEVNFLQKEGNVYDLPLGDSSSSAELLLHEHKKVEHISGELRDKALKITKATEHLVSSGPAPGGQSSGERRATSRAYAVLAGCTDFGELVDQRTALLMKAITFFRSAQAAQTKLDQLEVQLCTMPKGYGISNSQLASLHSQVSKALDDVVEAPIQEGNELLREIGNRGSRGTQGVKKVIEELENRKIRLGNMCTAHKEENIRLTQALTLFLERQNELYSWLVSIAEAFLQGHQDMGSVYPMAQDFLELHQKLLNDLNLKGTEIEGLLSTLPPILEWLDGEQRTDISCKASALRLQWVDLRSRLESRIDLCTPYVAFHSLATRLTKEIDSAEEGFREKQQRREGNGDEMDAEQRWLSIQQLFLQLSNTGKNFLQDAEKATDPYLDIKRACLCVQTILEHLGSRQLMVNEAWEAWQQRITIQREFQVQWEKTMAESGKTLEWVSKLELQFYPVLQGQSSSSRTIVRELEERLQTFIPEVKRAQSEIELRVKTIEALTLRGDTEVQKDQVIKNLMELHQKFQMICTEYQILVQMLIAFFRNMSELDRTIENLQSQYRSSLMPRDLAEAEFQLKEHEASRQAVLELFKFTQAESEQIIKRIYQQEPFEPGKKDAEKVMQLLGGKRAAWEAAWAERRAQLEQSLQRCQFDCDLKQINSQLSDLGRQLSAIRGQYGESLATAQATSLAFVYFERTIEVLEQRIRTFITTGEHAGTGTRHGNLDDLDDSFTESHIHRELSQLQARWSAFHSQVVESRRLINLSIEYFTLVEEAEKWFKEGSKLLVTIARKSTAVKSPEEATQLLNEVEMFLKPGEIRQDERIKKISALAIELYGEEKSKQVSLVLMENKEMLDSFTIISDELNTLAKNLKAAEMQRMLQKKEQEEVDASLYAARAEAAAASAAAAAAEEARKAAEAAAKVLNEAAAKAIQEATIAQRSLIEQVHIHKIETVTSSSTREIAEEVKEKSPSPVKAVKVLEVEAPKPVAPTFTLALHDRSVQEGERLTLECKVTGDPIPEIVWYKDRISIVSNPDYHTSYVDGVCSLTIEETFAEDSAKFTCKATNVAGTAETSAMLSVKEAEMQDQLTPPLFTRNLAPSTAKEGSSFQLECSVSGNPLPTVQWFKGDTCIDSSPDYAITYNNGEAVLRFEEVFLDDQAEYRCRATNCVGSEESKAKLTVEAIEPSEAPSFVVPLSNVMARAGLKLKLECEVKGLPTPKLTWMHNGKVIKETRDVRISSDGKKETLVISEAFPKDAGIYVVSAKNKCGEASSSCNVSVKGRLPTETSDSELASDMEPVKPAIQVPLHDITSKEGEKIRLDCIIVGQPEPEVIWYHDDRPVKESADFQLLFQGDRCSLIIKEAYTEDSGDYKVVAINSAGEASSKCRLTVNAASEAASPAPAAEPVPIEPLPIGIAPRFNKLLTDVLAREGEEVVLECSVFGEPEPSVKWLLNNQEIVYNPRIKFDQDSSGSVTLTINSVSPDDRGVYTVKAANPSGEAKCFANLIVKAGQTPESQRGKPVVMELVENHTIPAFKELFSDKKVVQGDSVKFECIVTGRPTPKIRWCFNDMPVSGQGFWISTSGERQVLSIPDAEPRLSGKISCIAENEAGKATCCANLIVEAPAISEITNGTAEFDLSNQDDEDGLSSPSFSMKRAVFMQSSSQTQVIKTSSSSYSSISNKSGEPTISTQSQSISSQTEKAMKQVGNQPPLQVEAKKFAVIQQVNDNQPVVKQQASLIISEGDKKKIHEESYSSGDPSSVIAPLPSPPKPQRKSVAPRFISPLMGRIVDQGADLCLEAIIDGYPEPKVTWLKNGTEEVDTSKPESNAKVSFDHGKARLDLKNVQVKDAGRYTCKIENPAGSASSTADLVVKKTVFPPVFGRRLQAQVAKKGQRVVMEVEVTGLPDPTITWSKDGNTIIYNTKPYKIKHQGSSHSLIIDEASPSHSGRFTVRAVNAGGEAQSSADFVVVEEPPEGTAEQITTYVIEDIQETSRERKPKQATEKVVVVPRPVVAAEVEKPRIQTSPMPTDASKTEKPVAPTKDMPSSSVTEIVLETTQHTERHVSMKMQHIPVDDIPAPIGKVVSPVGTQLEKTEAPLPSDTTPDVPSATPEPEEEAKENDREKIQKELVEIQQQGNVQEALSKFKKLESQESPPLPKFVQQEEFKQEQASSDVLIVKKLSMASSVTRVDESSSSGRIIPIQVEQIEPQTDGKRIPPVTAPVPPPPQVERDEPIAAKPLESLILESGEEIQPGPPPEMGYIPKNEVSTKSQKEEVACKVRKLQEESEKVLSPIDIPSGGVRIFPVSTSAAVVTSTSMGTSSSAFTHWIGKEREQVKPPVSMPPEQKEVPPPPAVFYPIGKEEKEVSSVKETFTEKREMFMKEEIKKEIEVPPPFMGVPEKVLRPKSPLMRPLTPGSLVPSAEGIAMEKLWASRKTPEPEVVVTKGPSPTPYQVPPRESTKSPRPSAQGVAMDRLWAHKHPQRSIKMSWPPQQSGGEEERIAPVWVSKGESEPPKCPSPLPERVPLQPAPTVSSCEEVTSVKSSIMKKEVIQSVSSTMETVHEPIASKEAIFTPIPPPEPILKPAAMPEPVVMQALQSSFKPSLPSESLFKPVPQVSKEFRSVSSAENITESMPPGPPKDVLHYVAHVTHSSSAADTEANTISSEITSSTKMEVSSFERVEVSSTLESSTSENAMVVEEKVLKPSEAKKIWPPCSQPEFEMMAPPAIKTGVQLQKYVDPHPVEKHEDDIPIQLEPGPPPEIVFAEPTLERRVSKVESIELDLDKEPSKHIVGAVRTIPPPVKEKAKAEKPQASSSTTFKPIGSQTQKRVPVKKPKLEERPQSTPPMMLSAFKPFPELEPFPFKPEPSKQSFNKLPPPPKPSVFRKGEFTESDYESDVESIRIPAKWRPYGSDNEGDQPAYRRVRPPGSGVPPKRPTSVGPVPLPPSAFEAQPPKLEGPSPLTVGKEAKTRGPLTTKVSRTEQESKKHMKEEVKEVMSVKVIKKQVLKHEVDGQKRKQSPPGKIFTPPAESAPAKESEEGAGPKSPVKTKPTSPKMKIKKEMTESGYMADTDEPRWQQKEMKSSTVQSTSTATMTSKFEERVCESSQEGVAKSPQKGHHHHQASSKFLQQQQIAAAAELIGEGETHGVEPSVGRKPVKELIAPAIVKEIPLASKSKFSKKEQFEISSSSKPMGVPRQLPAQTEFILPEPGPPPVEHYAPPPQPQASAPGRKKKPADNNPLQAVETSNKMHFTESSETCHRVVSMEQTTRVIQFGDQGVKGVVHPIRSQTQPSADSPKLVELVELEPFPFKPDPQKPRHPSGPPPPKPKKFTKGEFRESDYESDVDSVRIKPIWAPHESDGDEPQYRKVRPPSTTPKRADTVDRGGPSPAPPTEFEKPPELCGPQKSPIPTLERKEKTKVITSTTKTEAEQKRLMRVEEMKRRFSGGSETQRTVGRPVDYSEDILLQPGEKPEYGFAEGLPAAASYAATHHMSEMSQTFKSKAQQFVNDIVKTTNQISPESKPNGAQTLPKSEEELANGSDPHAYREESRLSQFASPSLSSPWMGGVQGQSPMKISQGRGNTPTPPSTPSTPSSAHGMYVISPSQPAQPKKPPTFITPLRDIAVKSGGTARFECIVQAEPPPNILWSKNGRIIENSPDHEIHYRNGVCRLTIPEAYPEDAGTYTCTATNMLGTIGTTGSLQVPGVPSHKYGTYRQLFTGATTYGGGGGPPSHLLSDHSYPPLALALPLSPPPTPAEGDFASHSWSRTTSTTTTTSSHSRSVGLDDAAASLLMGE